MTPEQRAEAQEAARRIERERYVGSEFVCDARTVARALLAQSAEVERLREALEQMRKERDGEREAREHTSAALRGKDEAMGVLFKRLQSAGVDCDDLMP